MCRSVIQLTGNLIGLNGPVGVAAVVDHSNNACQGVACI